LILDLRPIVLDDLGLVAALRSYADQVLSPRDVEWQVAVQGCARRLPPELEITLFRIVEEAINNVANHAGAHQVNLTLGFRDESVQVTVQDDGCGFNVPSRFEPVEAWRGLGLLGMQERTLLAGGSFRIESQPGCGTCMVIQIPSVDPALGDPLGSNRRRHFR
jgi:signal transduction histidine kinase